MQVSVCFGCHFQGIFSPRRFFPPPGKVLPASQPCQSPLGHQGPILASGGPRMLLSLAVRRLGTHRRQKLCHVLPGNGDRPHVPISLAASSALARGLISRGKPEETNTGLVFCAKLSAKQPWLDRKPEVAQTPVPGGRGAGPAPP